MQTRTREEIEARIAIVRDSNDLSLTMAFDEAEKATRKMSPSAAYRLAYQIARQTEDNPRAIAVAKAVRWQRILERDFSKG